MLWWRREAWGDPGAFGREIMPLDDALEFVAAEGFFWIHASWRPRHSTCKAKLRELPYWPRPKNQGMAAAVEPRDVCALRRRRRAVVGGEQCPPLHQDAGDPEGRPRGPSVRPMSLPRANTVAAGAVQRAGRRVKAGTLLPPRQ